MLTVKEVLTKKIALEIECVDRVYYEWVCKTHPIARWPDYVYS